MINRKNGLNQMKYLYWFLQFEYKKKNNKTSICDTFPFKWQIDSFEITNNMEMCEYVCVFGRNSSNCFYCVFNVYVQWLKWDLVLHSFCNICNKLIIERPKKRTWNCRSIAATAEKHYVKKTIYELKWKATKPTATRWKLMLSLYCYSRHWQWEIEWLFGRRILFYHSNFESSVRLHAQNRLFNLIEFCYFFIIISFSISISNIHVQCNSLVSDI